MRNRSLRRDRIEVAGNADKRRQDKALRNFFPMCPTAARAIATSRPEFDGPLGSPGPDQPGDPERGSQRETCPMRTLLVAAALTVAFVSQGQAAPAKSDYCKMANGQRNTPSWNEHYGCLKTPGKQAMAEPTQSKNLGKERILPHGQWPAEYAVMERTLRLSALTKRSPAVAALFRFVLTRHSTQRKQGPAASRAFCFRCPVICRVAYP